MAARTNPDHPFKGAAPLTDAEVYEGRRAYRSPEGSYTRIKNAVLEDPTLTDAEHRALTYLATKPDEWVVSELQLARDLRRPRERMRLALRGLRRRGYLRTEAQRDASGRITRQVTRVCREMIIEIGKSPAQNQKVNAHPVVSYPLSNNGADSNDGAVLLEEVLKTRPDQASAPLQPDPADSNRDDEPGMREAPDAAAGLDAEDEYFDPFTERDPFGSRVDDPFGLGEVTRA